MKRAHWDFETQEMTWWSSICLAFLSDSYIPDWVLKKPATNKMTIGTDKKKKKKGTEKILVSLAIRLGKGQSKTKNKHANLNGED